MFLSVAKGFSLKMRNIRDQSQPTPAFLIAAAFLCTACSSAHSPPYCPPVGCGNALRVTIKPASAVLQSGSYKVEVVADGQPEMWTCMVPASGSPAPCSILSGDAIAASLGVAADRSELLLDFSKPAASIAITVWIDDALVWSGTLQPTYTSRAPFECDFVCTWAPDELVTL